MNRIPKAAEPLIREFADAFTQPTYRRFVVFLFAAILGPGKTDRTFSDAITAVRRWLWTDWVFATPAHGDAFAKRSQPIRAVLLYALAAWRREKGQKSNSERV